MSRHPIIVAVLILEIAGSFGVIGNIFSSMASHMEVMRVASGLDEGQLFFAKVNDKEGSSPFIPLREGDVARIAHIAGVSAVAYVDSLPLSGDSWSVKIRAAPEGGASHRASVYTGSEEELSTLGLKLVEGRNFSHDEYLPLEVGQDYDGANKASVCILSKSLARQLGLHVGALIYGMGKTPLRVVGIVDALASQNMALGPDGQSSLLLPLFPDASTVYYVFRLSAPTDAAFVLHQVRDQLSAPGTGRVFMGLGSYASLKKHATSRDDEAVRILIAASLMLLSVTFVGVFGLFNFWVAQRTRSIGIRRALGATRQAIRLEFQVEGVVLTTGGLALGAVLAIFIGAHLVTEHSMQHLVAGLLSGGAALLLLGQIAVLGPAVRASNISPAAAIRAR